MNPTGTVLDGLGQIATTGRRTQIYFPRPGETSQPPESSNESKTNHGVVAYGFAYVNDVGSGGFRRRPFSFPVGTMIVREKMLTPTANPDLLVVMIKREKAFNPRANGWQFLIMNGDATKILRREKNGQCLKCHQYASNNDFVYPEDGLYR
jgi:hypothetical protein